jgi:hypothetical protein
MAFNIVAIVFGSSQLRSPVDTVAGHRYLRRIKPTVAVKSEADCRSLRKDLCGWPDARSGYYRLFNVSAAEALERFLIGLGIVTIDNDHAHRAIWTGRTTICGFERHIASPFEQAGARRVNSVADGASQGKIISRSAPLRGRGSPVYRAMQIRGIPSIMRSPKKQSKLLLLTWRDYATRALGND